MSANYLPFSWRNRQNLNNRKMEVVDMDVDFKVDKTNRIIYLKIFGKIEPGEINQFMLEVIQHEEFEANLDLIADLTEAQIDSEFEAVVRFNNTLQAIKSHWGESRWAVIPGNQTNYRTIQRQIFLSENATIYLKIFNELSSAQMWLTRSRMHENC